MPPDPLDWLREENLLSTERLGALVNIRRQSGRVLEPQKLFHYTDHGLDHSNRVLNNLRRLVADNVALKEEPPRLNEYELTCLVAACYLHDIGMQALMFVQDEAKTSGFSTELSERVRDQHAQFSARLIEESLGKQRHEFPPLGLDQDTVIESLADFIRDIVKGHSGRGVDLTGVKAAYDKPIRVGFLTALFRLADGLDLNEARVDLDRLKQFRITERSQLHWWRHHYVRSVQIENGLITIHMSFPPPLGIVFVDYFKELVLDDIRRELIPSNKILFSNGVRFLLDEEVQSSHDETLSRRMPTANLIAFIEEELKARGEKFSEIQRRSQDLKPIAASTHDWISYWKFKGNPWVDLPLQYRDEEFVETENVRGMLAELNSIVTGKRGDLRLLIGERGSGKTTFFNVFDDFFQGQDVRARYLDISEEIFEIRHPKEIYDWLFRKIYGTAVADSTDEFTEAKLRRVIRSYSGGKLVLGIDNMDRFVRPAEQEIVKQFFAMGQGLLQELKSKFVIVISCAPTWKTMLDAQDLHYLSTKSAWKLGPFKRAEVRELLDRRLRPSGLKFEDIFDESILTPISTLSGGNPRRVVQLAEDLCRRAAVASAKKIDTRFVDAQDLQEVLPRMTDNITRISKISDYYSDAVSRFFLFNERLERERLSSDAGWETARQLIEGVELQVSQVDEQFLGALGNIATRFPKQVAVDKFEVQLVLYPEIVDFCKKWTEAGFSTRDFITAFRLHPISPARMDARAAERIFGVQVSPIAQQHFDSAKETYDRVLGLRLSAVESILASWEALSDLLTALYLHHGVVAADSVNPPIGGKGLPRTLRDRGQLAKEMGSVLGRLTKLATLTGYIRYFDDIYFVANKAKKVLLSKPRYLVDFTARDAELSKLSMKKVFLDLMPLFQVVTPTRQFYA